MKEKNIETLKTDKKKKRISILWHFGLFICLFGVTACAAYYLVPDNKKSIADEDMGVDDSSNGTSSPTPEQMLISNLTNLKGLQADVTANVSIPDEKDIANPNVVNLSDANVKLVMNGWPNIAFSFDSTMAYNGLRKHFAVSYADKNIYLSVLGLKYKTIEENRDLLADDLYDLFKDAGLPAIDASSFDISSFTKIFDRMTHAGDSSTGYVYTVPVFAKTENLPEQDIFISTTGDCQLQKVWADDFDFKGVKITFVLNANINAVFEESSFIPSDSAVYLDVYKSVSIVHRVKELVNKEQTGLSLSASVSKNVVNADQSNTKGVAVTSVSGTAFLDAKNEKYGTFLRLDTPFQEKETIGGVETIVDKVESQTLAANYFGFEKEDGAKDGTVYASYNDAFKLSMTTSTLQNLIDKIKADFPVDDESSVSKAFAFITESVVMRSVLKGHYQEVANMLQSVTATDGGLVVDVSLADLGLGEQSLVKVALNTAETSWVSIDVSNLQLSNYYLNCAVSLMDYAEPTIVKADYETLDKLVNVYDQVHALSQSEQSGLDFSGAVDYGKSVGSKAMTGFSFAGDTEFDIKNKSGTGFINIASQTASFIHNHQVMIDVRGTDSMLFKYTSDATSYNDAIYGKNTIRTLNDIIDLVRALMNSSDERYTKFVEPLKEQSASMAISKIIGGDYEELLKDKLLTKLDVHSDAIELTVSKKLLSSDSDIDVMIGIDDDGKAKTLAFSRFVMQGVAIDLNLTIKAFDAAHITKLPDPDKQDYMDFSDIAVLLKFGIKTSELNYYRITGKAGVSLLGFSPIQFDVDFHIYVDGKTVKAVGYMNGIPLIGGVNGTAVMGLGTRNVTFVYETGYCYLIGSDDYAGFLRDSTDTVKVQDAYFANNLLHYLLNNIIQLTSDNQKKIDTASKTAATSAAKYEDVLTKFDVMGADSNAPSWTLQLNAGALAQDDALKTLDCTISGITDGNGGTYLNKISATLDLVAIVDIKITLNANLVDIGANDSSFFSTTWQGLVNKYSSLSIEGA